MILSDEEDTATDLMVTAKLVEYLEPLMSRDLLCKFPDNSVFGFDYSQSSIWSPLIPRAHASIDLDSDTPPPPKKRLFLLHSGRKIKGSSVRKKKKKMTAPASKLNLRLMQNNKKRKKKKKASGLSPTPSKGANCLPFATKGLNKVLRAATKHFKKKIPRGPMAHVKLCNYFEGDNI